MNQGKSARGGERAGNNPWLAQVVIAGLSHLSNMLSKRQFLVQDDPKVLYRGGEDKGRELRGKGLRAQLIQLLAGAHPNMLSFMWI